MTVAKRRAAKRPPVRTVVVGIPEGDFAGWQATMRVDFPARLLEDLESKNAMRFLGAMDQLVVEHNFPNSKDELAVGMIDVDPYTGVVAICEAYLDALKALPPR